MMSRFRWALAGALALASLASTSPALAHGALKASVPTKGAHLVRAPQEIRLTFTEAPELAVTRIELIGPDGAPVTLDALRTLPDSAKVIIARITGSLAAGSYSVRWQIAGKDGHPVRDRFAFTIAPGATGLGGQKGVLPLPAQDSGAGRGATVTPQHHDPVSMPESDTAFDAESPLYAVVRWLTFAGILVVLGVLAFHYGVLGFLRKKSPDATLLAAMRTRAATIGWWAAGLLVLVALVRLYAQSYALHGARQALSRDLVAGLLGQTLWGRAWLLQVSAAIVIAVAFQSVRRGSSPAWGVAAIAAVALAVTPALSGHAVASPQLTGLAVLADTAHVIGAGGWLGSLLILVAAGIPSALRLPEVERGPAVASLVNAFSPTALVFAGVLAVTGAVAAWLHLGALSALWQSDYGRTLLVKLAVLSVVAGTGAYNWLRVKPTLGGAVGTQRIRRSATMELMVAALVLAVTAVLVATPPPLEMADAKAGVRAAIAP